MFLRLIFFQSLSFLFVVITENKVQSTIYSQLKWNKITPIYLFNTSSVILKTPEGMPSDTAFIFLKAHVYQPHSNFSLSFCSNYPLLQTVVGFNQGLVSLNTSVTDWYLKQTNFIYDNMTVWVMFEDKDWSQPIPGACDLVSMVTPYPALSVSSSDTMDTISFSLANYFNKEHKIEQCDNSVLKHRLRYRLYAHWLKDFSEKSWDFVLRRMSTADGVITDGVSLGIVDEDELNHLNVAVRKGYPVIYAVVVEYDVQFTAYVSSTAFSCFDHSGNVIGCSVASTTGWRVFTAVICLFGIYLCTFGFKFYTFSIFLMTFFSIICISLPICARYLSGLIHKQDWVVYFCSSGLLGVVVAGLALLIWLKTFNILMASTFVLLPLTLVLCSVLWVTPFGDLWWLKSEDYVFVLALIFLILLLILIFLLFSLYANILAMCVVGSYLVALFISSNFIVASSFPYIWLDMFNRLAVPGFNKARHFTYTGKIEDILLFVSWVLVVFVCYCFQYKMNKSCLHPAFRKYQILNTRPVNYGRTSSVVSVPVVDEWPSGNAVGERTPLLSGPSPVYTENT